MTRYRLTDSDAEVTALSELLYAEIERRDGLGGLRDRLDHPDEATARAAWWELAALAEELAVPEALWARFMGQYWLEPTEEGPNHA